MFIGHFGLGFAAKRLLPNVSLGMLFLAAQFIDLLWPLMLLVGLESVVIDPSSPSNLIFISYPYSHSLVFVIIWGVLFGLVHFLFNKDVRSAVFLGILVLSHWVLDLIVHNPDLPLLPGTSLFVGMGLWNNFLLSFVLEMAIFVAGAVVYLRMTRAENMKGSMLVWILIGLLLASHAANLFGPPPPSVSMIAWAGNLMWLFVFIAYFADNNRNILVRKIKKRF